MAGQPERRTAAKLSPGATLALAVAPYGELAYWQTVPYLVQERYKEAADIQKRIQAAVNDLPAMPGYGHVYWNPSTKACWVVLGDSDEQEVHDQWRDAVKSVDGVQDVCSEAETGPHDGEWIKIKRANAPLGWLHKPFELAGSLSGGPTPLSNAIVGGLLAGGLGYAGGTLAEQVLPQKHFDRGKLRRTLGLLGLGLGTLPGIAQGMANVSNSRQAGKPLGWRSWITPTNDMPANPQATRHELQLRSGQPPLELPTVDPPVPYFAKVAAEYASAMTGVGGIQPVPVDAFNQAIWNDVTKGIESTQRNSYGTRTPWETNETPMHTPPMIGAAASGLVSGIQSSYGGQSVLSPRHFISGLTAAGVDAVTARLAGGTLGILGGLNPAAQNTLQNMGIWSGLIRGVTQSVLGL